MITLKIALSFLKRHWKLTLICLLVIALIGLWKSNKNLKIENTRQSENFEQSQQTNQVLNLNLDEYKLLNSKTKDKLDSVLKVINVKPKQVKSATIIQTVYKDTGSVKIIYKTITKMPDLSFKIPFESDDSLKCWGVKGLILTKDQNAKVKITERTANNANTLVVVKPKKFLFWTVKKADYKLRTDCGESKFTEITFEKR